MNTLKTKDMYFWNIHQLKKDLQKKSLTQQEQFEYLIASTILFSAAIIPYFETNIWDMYASIIEGLITIAGIIYIYKMNGGAKGKHLLQRFLSLSWVVGIRWIVLIALPLIIVFFTTLEFSSIGIQDTTTAHEAVFYNILYLIYIYLIGKHIQEIATK